MWIGVNLCRLKLCVYVRICFGVSFSVIERKERKTKEIKVRERERKRERERERERE